MPTLEMKRRRMEQI